MLEVEPDVALVALELLDRSVGLAASASQRSMYRDGLARRVGLGVIAVTLRRVGRKPAA